MVWERVSRVSVTPNNPVTMLLHQAAHGDSGAVRTLLPLIYDELRALAAARLALQPVGHTLQATALVNEAYLKLVSGPQGDAVGFASRAQFFPAGAIVAVGVEVEVEGTASNGVIMATKVSIETEDDDELAGFELHGAISTLNTTTKTFVLRGVTVSYGGTAVVFKGGMESDLADGRRVEVKGILSTDGTKLQATTIRFEH